MEQVIYKEPVKPLSIPVDDFIFGWHAQLLQMLEPGLTPQSISLLIMAAFIKLQPKQIQYESNKEAGVEQNVCQSNSTLCLRLCNLIAILFRTSICSETLSEAMFGVCSI